MKLPFSFKDHKIKIGKTYVGEGCPTFFIAEIGLNHNGKVAMAKELISEAKRAGAQAVKFQKRNMIRNAKMEKELIEYTLKGTYMGWFVNNVMIFNMT